MESISFEYLENKVILCYTPAMGFDDIFKKLNQEDGFLIKHAFFVTRELLIESDEQDDFEESLRFNIGQIDENYKHIDSKVLGTKHEFYFGNEVKLKSTFFIAYRNISILKKIDQVIENDFYIGGDWEKQKGISFEAFKRLIDTFPKSAELDHYADMRISTILEEYYPECEKYKVLYEKFIQQKSSRLVEDRTDSTVLPIYNLKIEQAKFEVAVTELEDMLCRSEGIPETEWQKKICGILRFVYPKYITYSRETQYPGCDKHDKKPDFLLVDSCGFVDILEIKKANVLVLSQRKYRNNYVPSRELLGAIQQTEKYIYCLNTVKEAREAVRKRLCMKVPEVDVNVLNPQGMILIGRNKEFVNTQQISDFELIRRQYKHIVDIMTFDDLLQRLKNIVAALKEQNKSSV